MKRALHGMPAYSSILSAELPAKTKTYTPIRHSDIINRVRTEIRDAGFKIVDEKYRSSNEGKIALGTFLINYKSDPDIYLAASFVNSYNKQYAFRFNLGGVDKVTGISMILNNASLGSYKRVHKGNADILATGKIAEFVGDAGEYWDSLIEHKAMLKEITLSTDVRDLILGRLFFRNKVLNGMQMNIIENEIRKPSFTYGTDEESAWSLYCHIALAMKEARPATWMDDQTCLHEAFDDIINFGSRERGTSIVGLTTKRFFSSGAVEKHDKVELSKTEIEEEIAKAEAAVSEVCDTEEESSIKVTTIKASDFVKGKPCPPTDVPDYSFLADDDRADDVGEL